MHLITIKYQFEKYQDKCFSEYKSNTKQYRELQQ